MTQLVALQEAEAEDRPSDRSTPQRKPWEYGGQMGAPFTELEECGASEGFRLCQLIV